MGHARLLCSILEIYEPLLTWQEQFSILRLFFQFNIREFQKQKMEYILRGLYTRDHFKRVPEIVRWLHSIGNVSFTRQFQ